MALQGSLCVKSEKLIMLLFPRCCRFPHRVYLCVLCQDIFSFSKRIGCISMFAFPNYFDLFIFGGELQAASTEKCCGWMNEGKQDVSLLCRESGAAFLLDHSSCSTERR